MLRDGIELFRHQKIFLSLLRSEKPIAGFLDMGVGKTLPTLHFIAELLRDGKIENALVVAPAATQGVWYRDMELFKPEVRERLESAVTVVSYDTLWRRAEYTENHWGIVVLDESHYIKNRTAKRTKGILKMAPNSDYRVILTGTPIGNRRMEDIYSQFTFLYPEQRGKYIHSEIFGSWSEFVKRYCILDRYWKPYRYLNVAELQDIIAEHSYRVTIEECKDLPEVLDDEVWELELASKTVYKDMAKDGVNKKLKMVADNALSKMLRLRQICSGFITHEDEVHSVKTSKLKALDEFLDGFEKKLVIYAEFTESIRRIGELLRKRNIKYVVLDGKTKDKNIWRKFQSDDSIRVIICQSQAAGAGIDLFAADTELFYELTLSSTTHQQCRARIHRVGQTQRCRYVYFVTKGTVERAIYRSLKQDMDFSEKLFEEYMDDYQKGFNR